MHRGTYTHVQHTAHTVSFNSQAEVSPFLYLEQEGHPQQRGEKRPEMALGNQDMSTISRCYKKGANVKEHDSGKYIYIITAVLLLVLSLNTND